MGEILIMRNNGIPKKHIFFMYTRFFQTYFKLKGYLKGSGVFFEDWNIPIYGFRFHFRKDSDLKRLFLRWDEEVEGETGFKYSYQSLLSKLRNHWKNESSGHNANGECNLEKRKISKIMYHTTRILKKLLN